MRDPFSQHKKRFNLKQAMLAFDARFDSTLAGLRRAITDGWDIYSDTIYKRRVRGFKRFCVEIASESLTLGFVGLMFLTILALPAMEIAEKGWKPQEDISVIFVDRYGEKLGQRGVRLDDAVPLEQIPDFLIKAALATEDRRFYEHIGLDFKGLARAMVTNARANSVVEGGSTLTQQLAKNLFLTSERSLDRKIKEAFLALWLESHYTKQEILKLYLDRAYMGGGVFGVESAAQFYFGKSVRDISLSEAAMMAGLFKAPGRYAPHINLPAARARANEVLDNLVQAGFMTNAQVLAARRNPADVIDSGLASAPDYFLDWAFDEVKKIVPATDKVLVVRTTLDPTLQTFAERTMADMMRTYSETRETDASALVSMERDGGVRAMVGGPDYGVSQFNRATQAARQPGSAFKLYVYLTAFSNGYSPESIMADAPISIGNWRPQNYGRSYAGQVSLRTALTRSINTIPIRLTYALGREKVIETAYRVGVDTTLRSIPSLPLGASEVTLLELTGSYSTVANGGYLAKPYAFTRILTTQGDVIFDRNSNTRTLVVDPRAAEQVNSVLADVVTSGTARRAQIEGIVAAGKTGTTSDYRDAWFVGYTGRYTTGVWFGNDDFSKTGRITGGSLPAEAWQKYMAFAHSDGQPIAEIPGVPGSGRGATDVLLSEGGIIRNSVLGVGAAQALKNVETDLRRAIMRPQANRGITEEHSALNGRISQQPMITAKVIAPQNRPLKQISAATQNTPRSETAPTITVINAYSPRPKP
jgi:penicillin-binding protein 1A